MNDQAISKLNEGSIQQIWKSSVKKLMTRFECNIIDEKRFSSSVATTQTGTQKTSSSVRFCYRLTLVAFPKYLQFYTNAVLSHATSCHHSAHYIPKKWSISWLLMPLSLACPGHRYPFYYWLCRVNGPLSFMRECLNCMQHLDVGK